MRFSFIKDQLRLKLSVILTVLILLILAQPATAHHPFGGETPSNFFEGFLSGLGHPIIGLDHFAFIIASGLLGTKFKQGFLIPIAFVMATMIGTGIHLQAIDLPYPEMMIATSVIIFGGLLAKKKHDFSFSNILTLIFATVAMIAGIFHGYAYGEAVIGAEMNPIIAYLAGFAMIQLLCAFSAFGLASLMNQQFQDKANFILRVIGFGISGIGFVFFGLAFGG
ncbi:hydrogenase accessory protein [Crocosphaera subtropica ATCC 51142]|uniref:Hydrogenase accessory protein n=1 Tax=Crocosphaera subtropica (strain ATCC 51142 / BH68) TaxID=43989 RepID=B1WSX2_CROS5|nr:HupE/UreJ family protein [Crocosphaera subtropica]ACB50302.1 hydrogenase accessory protein [Crocosphaera subtropica ATCC 51142]